MPMVSKNKGLRLILFGGPILALAAAALFLTFGPGSGERAEADSPHAGLNFALGIDYNGDGTNDCGTGAPSAVGVGAPEAVPVAVSNTTCAAGAGAALQVNVYLMNAGGAEYGGTAAHVFYTGVAPVAAGTGTSHWTCHLFDVMASNTDPGAGPLFENAGSAHGFAPPTCAVGQTSLGLLHRFAFTCVAGGTIRLGHGVAETALTGEDLIEHREGGVDDLTVSCGGGPVDTPVPTTGPTDTPPPGETPTNTPSGPPNTPMPTNTTGPTNTPRPATATNTPRPATATPDIEMGDVNGDGMIDVEDALWILWEEAGIADVPLPENADVNDDGEIDSIDALFVLWMVGGEI